MEKHSRTSPSRKLFSMDSEALSAKPSGSTNADLNDQPKQRHVNKQDPKSSSSLSQHLKSPSQTSSSPSASTRPHSNNKDNIVTDKVKMANRTDSWLMLLIIVATVPTVFAALLWMGVSWKWFGTVGALLFSAVGTRVAFMNMGYNMGLNSITQNRWWNSANAPAPNLDNLPACYFLYVLGSGGHTAEMFELLRVSVNPAPNVHRRYLFTTGDNNSLRAIFSFEKLIENNFGPNRGTWDAYQVPRARNVHQPLYTAWVTSLLSALSIFGALTTPPDDRRTPEEKKDFKFPHVIVTNGPGTGVMTAIVARLLKVFFIAPNNCMKVVFIETWAHVRTLSLTGKIFRWGTKLGGIVDVFRVQHKPLADKYGYEQFEFITFR